MKKLWLAGVLLNSISGLASNSQLPEFEDVKQGLLSSSFTIDRASKAGEAYGRAARSNRFHNEGVKDDEIDLLKAVQLGHAYAPRVLYQVYKNEKYRELLMMAVFKKLADGFDAGLKEDMALLGHTFLVAHNYSLKALLDHASSLTEDPASEQLPFLKSNFFYGKKINYYCYIIESTWRELEAYIDDVDQAEAIINSARQVLESLAMQEAKEDCEASLAVGRFAMAEKNLEKAKTHLLGEKTLAFIGSNRGSVREDWSQAVKAYINLVADAEKVEIYQILGRIYKNKRQFMEAFDSFVEAYKLILTSSDQALKNSLFIECANIFQISQKDLGNEWDEKAGKSRPKSVGPYRFLGYQFYTEMSELSLEERNSMASNYLKEAITEGYTPALSKIVVTGEMIFETPLEAAQFLEDIVTIEWGKAQASEKKLAVWNPNRESLYSQFEGHPSEVIKALEEKLLNLFTQAQDKDFDLKLSTSKSLIRRLGSDFVKVTSGKVLTRDHPTARYLDKHRDMLNFIRAIDISKISEEDKDWFKDVQASLERIFKNGIHFEETKKEYDNTLPSWMTPKKIKIVTKKFLFEPEVKEN